ncbi:hypothetical protein [Rheinheimera pleomorphica]|uniref:hypothetical protein n=1 Tax=Rheinheimera pleomorphica TaxID=2703963 RepID=UPI00141F30BA|nr:hypothetical protein [Rheinheimera pleomorphica]
MSPLQQVRRRLGEHTELVNRRTLITLTLVTSVLLWLLKPNDNLLLSLLKQSDDPSVAIAFTRVLQQEQRSVAIDQLLAQQLYRTGDYEDALTLLTPLSKFDDSPDMLAAHQLYTSLLLTLSTKQRDARANLQHYLANLPSGLPEQYQRKLADYALQINQPELALAISKQLPGSNQKELIALALKAGQPLQATLYAGQVYQREPSQEHLLQLLKLLEASERGEQALALAKRHANKYRCSASCLQYFVALALRNNASNSAFDFAVTKLALTNANADLLQAANLAEANGHLDQATAYLETLGQRAPSRQLYEKLHQYYRWQQQTHKALQLSRKLVTQYTDISTITKGLEDALAESDLSAKADFYKALAQQRHLTDNEVWSLVDASDKAYGANNTLTTLNTLAQLYPTHARILAQLARFYLFMGQPEQAASIWPRYSQTEDMRFAEVQWFAKAFSALGQPEQALAVLHQSGQTETLNTSQLEELLDLANYTANRPLQRYYQQQLVLQPDNALDAYLAVATHSDMTAQDQAFLWQLFQQKGALSILSALVNHAIEHQDAGLLEQAIGVLNQLDFAEPQVLQLRVYISLYQQNYALAEQLVRQQLAQPSIPDSVWQSAAWLALLRQNTAWLSHLYPQLLQQNQRDAEHLRLLAAAAQALGKFHQASYWHQMLAAHTNYQVQDKINHALLAEHMGDFALAQQLRWLALTDLSQQLQALPEGKLTYQSLLSSMVSPGSGAAGMLRDLYQQADANTLMLLAQSSLSRDLAAQQFWYQQLRANEAQLSASLSLAMALAQQDHDSIKALVYDKENSLTPLERGSALEQIGHMQAAWQFLQYANNPILPVSQRPVLQRLAAALHPNRTRGMAADFTQFSSWDVNQLQVHYQQPLDNHQFILNTQHITAADTASTSDFSATQLSAHWHIPLSDNIDSLGLSALLRQRLTQLTLGQQLQLSLASSPRWQHLLQLQHSMPANLSKNSFLYAQQDRLSWQPVWQFTRHNQLTASVAKTWLNTDFNEPIASQWQLQLQLSEQLSRLPFWQVYSQFDIQRSDLATTSLDRLSDAVSRTLVATDFVAPHYRRLSIGQRIARGEVGKPGAQMPHYRYLLDTALGYNLVTSSVEYSVKAGVGVRVFGNDEVFFNINWQSADRLGQENIDLSLGYSLDF